VRSEDEETELLFYHHEREQEEIWRRSRRTRRTSSSNRTVWLTEGGLSQFSSLDKSGSSYSGHMQRQQENSAHQDGWKSLAATSNLLNLRRSVQWSTPPRLESLLVLELKQDGGRKYLSLSVRGLYKHVLTSITTTTPSTRGGDEEKQTPKPTIAPGAPQPSSRKVKLGDALVSPVPLGLAVVAQDDANTAATSEDEEKRVSFEAELRNKRSSPSSPPSRTLTKSSIQKSASTLLVDGQQQVTYRERLGGYLHPRDMRKLVTPFSASNEPELIVRRHVMLLNFDPLRAIVLRDRLLVIVPDGADSVLVHLENKLRGHSDEVEATIFGSSGASSTAPVEKLNSTVHSVSSQASDYRKPVEFVNKLFHKNPASSYSQISSHKHHSADNALDEKKNISESSLAEEKDTSDDEDEDDNRDLDEVEKEWNELKSHEWADLPFELQCVDAVLHQVCSILSEDTLELHQASLQYIERLLSDHGGMTDDPLHIIRAVKDAVREMSSRVKGFVKSITRVLNEDEDMALMNLSRLLTHPERFIQPVPQEVLEAESDEPELILEAHLQTAFTLTNSLDLIQGQIDTAAELVDQKLDAIRNRLLYANMVISILSLCVTCASLVGSLFGMNLKNPYEEDPNAFRRVTAGTAAGTVFMAGMIMFLLRYLGTIPTAGFSSGGE
jgi:hypothetical protein